MLQLNLTHDDVVYSFAIIAPNNPFEQHLTGVLVSLQVAAKPVTAFTRDGDSVVLTKVRLTHCGLRGLTQRDDIFALGGPKIIADCLKNLRDLPLDTATDLLGAPQLFTCLLDPPQRGAAITAHAFHLLSVKCV